MENNWVEIPEQDLSKIPIGTTIRDVEDSDCYFEGIWHGEDKYLVTRTVWIGEESLTSTEDSTIGQVIGLRWWKVMVKVGI